MVATCLAMWIGSRSTTRQIPVPNFIRCVVIAAAVSAGELMRISEHVVLAPGADVAAAEILAGLRQPFTAAEARQALGTTRRTAIPLLEFLDAAGLTVRLADDRRLVRAAAESVAPRDGDDRAVVNGLYAVGECACVSVHGANRLGTNSLLDLIVFGRSAGNFIVEQALPRRSHKALPKDAGDRSLARLARLDGFPLCPPILAHQPNVSRAGRLSHRLS